MGSALNFHHLFDDLNYIVNLTSRVSRYFRVGVVVLARTQTSRTLLIFKASSINALLHQTDTLLQNRCDRFVATMIRQKYIKLTLECPGDI